MDSRNIYVSSNYDEYEFKSRRIWRTDGKYEPFVYIIQEVETEMMYIGSRTRFSGRPCLESDLGKIYFTSSTKFDWESDPKSFEICKIIPCASNHDASILESILIDQNDAVWDDTYYNLNNGGSTFNTSGSKRNTVSEPTRRKISKAGKGRKFSKEHRSKISESLKGRKDYGFHIVDKSKTFCLYNRDGELFLRVHGNLEKELCSIHAPYQPLLKTLYNDTRYKYDFEYKNKILESLNYIGYYLYYDTSNSIFILLDDNDNLVNTANNRSELYKKLNMNSTTCRIFNKSFKENNMFSLPKRIENHFHYERFDGFYLRYG